MIDSRYSELPPEILIKIFQYLEFYDIQSVRLCCKQWFAVTKLPEFESKGIFKITSCLLESNHPAAEVIFEKRIKKLYLKSVIFGDVDKLFRHIGSSLKGLTLKLVPIAAGLRLTFEYFPHLSALNVTQIKVPSLVEELDFLPIGRFTRLKELKLIANDSSVNKFLLNCTLHTHALERLTVEFTRQDEAEVLNVLEKYSDSLTRLDLRFYQNRPLEVAQWRTILVKIKLNELSLQGSFCSEILSSATKSQRSLRSLDVTGSVAVDDDYLVLIGEELCALERLILAYCGRITDQGVRHLAKLPQLKILDISCCNLLTSVGVRSIIGQPPNSNLLELHLQELNLNEEVICFCANNLPNLRIFNLSGCNSKALTNEAIQEIFDCQRKLRDLRVDNCFRLSDAGILGLTTGTSIQYLKFLERLSLRGCKQLSDVTLICGLKLPKLKFLDIVHCDAMTNHGLESLVQNCPTIEEICITHSSGMNYDAIRTLTLGLGRLRMLTVSNCKDPSLLGAKEWNEFRFRKIMNEVTLKRYPRPH